MAFGVVGMFGLIPFFCSDKRILTFKDLSRTNTMRFAKHEVIGKKPVLEKIGLDLRTISFTIRLDQSHLGGFVASVPAAILLFSKMLEKGEEQTLIIGGEVMGKYVIESIDEERKFHNGIGLCSVAELTLSLTEWGG